MKDVPGVNKTSDSSDKATATVSLLYIKGISQMSNKSIFTALQCHLLSQCSCTK